MTDDLALSSIELCAGVGMLGEGVRAAFDFLGIRHRTVCYVEREAPAAGQLVALMEAGALDTAPIWSDLLTLDGDRWRGKVDCIVAGFPCQDMSIAGKREGLDGQRSGLFFDILDLADHCGARILALENVSGIHTATASVVDEEEGDLLERAAARVVGELADRGWSSEWITLSASDVGASHGRARWFCLAWRVENANAGDSGQRRVGRDRPEGTGVPCLTGEESAMADASGHGGHGPYRQTGLGRGVREASDAMGNPVGATGRRQDPERSTGRGNAPTGTGRALALPSGDGWHERRAEPGGKQGRPDATECGCAMADTANDHGRRGECRAQAGTGACGCGRRGPASGGADVAHAGDPRLQGHEFCRSHDQDGRTDGRSRNHADQLPNFIMMNFSPPDQQTPDGEESSPSSLGSRRRLNPAFGCRLMGWPSWWTNPGITSSVKSEMESYRSALRSHLSSLLGEQES